MALMQPTKIQVGDEGELVVIQIGDVEVKVHYSDAFVVAQWIRTHGRLAKNFAGDKSKHDNAYGVLSGIDGVSGKIIRTIRAVRSIRSR